MRSLMVCCALALVIASPSLGGPSWKAIKSKTATGQFAVTAINAAVKYPKALGLRLIGKVSSGIGVVACSKGFSVTSTSRSARRAGTFRLPMTRGAETCDITASVGGSGRVTTQILKR
jgi:hypothetical protein